MKWESVRTPGRFEITEETRDRLIIVVSLDSGCKVTYASGGRMVTRVPSPGSVSIFPAGLRFRQTIDNPASALIFRSDWREMEKLIAACAGPGLGPCEIEPRMCVNDASLVRSLFTIAAAGSDDDRDEARIALAEGLTANHSTAGDALKGQIHRGGLSSSSLRRVFDAVEAGMAADGVECLAAEAGLSLFHFIREFRTTVGMTPHQYVISRKLEHALGLVAAGVHGSADVARLSGFTHASHLSRALRKRYGIRPSELRRLVLPQRTTKQVLML